MSVQRALPSPALAGFVESFGLREARLGETPFYRPLPARTDCFLEFYLADRYRIVDVANGAVHHAPRVVLVGPHTRRREDLLLSGTIRVFNIRFTPTGFRRLFAIPAAQLANCAENAELVLGPQIRELGDRLAEGRELPQLVRIAQRFLAARLATMPASDTTQVVAAMARALKRQRGKTGIAPLAASHSLSVRQLERLFQEHVGVSPKLFGRIERLNFALEFAQKGAADWAGIAADAGYYDQSHMVRDFRALTGETPERFSALEQRAKTFAGLGSAKDVAFVLSRASGAA